MIQRTYTEWMKKDIEGFRNSLIDAIIGQLSQGKGIEIAVNPESETCDEELSIVKMFTDKFPQSEKYIIVKTI